FSLHDALPISFDTEFVVLPVVREDSGLAMSSRNEYLNVNERRAALVLNEALLKAQAAYNDGEHDSAHLIEIARSVLEKEPLARIEYVSINDPDTFEKVDTVGDRPALISLAAFIGSPRLIDNVILRREPVSAAA